MSSNYRTLIKIPLHHHDGSDKPHPRFTMEKGSDKTQKAKRFDFLMFAANNEIDDEASKAAYKEEMKIDLPSMANWKEFLTEIKNKRKLAPYANF
jgi:hypothetical protein